MLGGLKTQGESNHGRHMTSTSGLYVHTYTHTHVTHAPERGKKEGREEERRREHFVKGTYSSRVMGSAVRFCLAGA